MKSYLTLRLLLCGLLTLSPAVSAALAQLPPSEQEKLLNEANALNAQGSQLYQQGRFPEATERFQKALEVLRQAYPKEQHAQGNPLLARALNNLGFVFQAQGDHGKAEPLLREALAM